MVEDQPMWRTGKICYIEISAVDVARSGGFYQQAFGWQMRTRGGGSTAFDDTVGQVSGTFVTGPPRAAEPGFVIYIMVADAAATLAAVQAAGGEIVRPADPRAPAVFAWFKDPGGNVLGVYQQPSLTQTEQAERAEETTARARATSPDDPRRPTAPAHRDRPREADSASGGTASGKYVSSQMVTV